MTNMESVPVDQVLPGGSHSEGRVCVRVRVRVRVRVSLCVSRTLQQCSLFYHYRTITVLYSSSCQFSYPLFVMCFYFGRCTTHTLLDLYSLKCELHRSCPCVTTSSLTFS